MIGLGHGGPYEGGGAYDTSTQQFGPYDYGLWAIMSYVEAWDTTAKFFNSYSVTGTDWGYDPTGIRRNSTTPMILDILAVQRILRSADIRTSCEGRPNLRFPLQHSRHGH